MAKKPKENVIPFTSDELPQAQADYFERRYELECKLVELRIQHLQPVQKDLKTANKDFLARAGVQGKEIDPTYQQWKLDREAEDFEKDSEREARRANMRRIFDALAKGQTLDWIKADAAIIPEPAAAEESPFNDEDDFGDEQQHGEQAEGESHAGPKELTGRAAAEREPEQEEAHPAWGATQAQDDGEEHADNEGELYQIGLRHGQAGNSELKPLLKQHNLRTGSAGATSMEAGHTKGFAEFNAAQAHGTDREGYQGLGHGSQAAE